MKLERATLTELYALCSDEMATDAEKWMAAHEIVRRQKLTRRPFRNKQQKIRKQVARW